MKSTKKRYNKVYSKPTKSKITTIKLDYKTKDRLDHLREHKETYNEIINKTLNLLNICLKNPLLAHKILLDIERSKKRENLMINPEKMLKRKSNIQTNLETMQSNFQKVINPNQIKKVSNKISEQELR